SAPPSPRCASGDASMSRDSGTSRRSREDEVCATGGGSFESLAEGPPAFASGALERGELSMARFTLARFDGVRGGGWLRRRRDPEPSQGEPSHVLEQRGGCHPAVDRRG